MVPTSTSLTPRAPILATLGLAVAALLLLGMPLRAAAQDQKTVTVLEIQGAPPKLQQALEKQLKTKYTVLPAAKWNSAAKRLNVTGQATDEVALVAGDLKVDAVITGKVKQDKDTGTYKLNIAARHGATGKPLGKLTYDLKSAKVDPATIAQAQADIEKAVEQAIAGPPPEVPVVATPAEPLTPSMRGEEENPLEKMRKMEEQAKRERSFVARPKYYPYFDVSAGFVLNGRSFSFTDEGEGSKVRCYDFTQKQRDFSDPSGLTSVYRYGAPLKTCPRYAPSVTGGVRVDLTVYPLAGVHVNALRGLGLGATFDYMFWPDSMTMPTTAMPIPRMLATREYKLEAGLRYHLNIANKRNLPSLLFNAQYGIHSFAVAKEAKAYGYTDDNGVPQTAAGLDDHGLPDILYQYVNLGVGARVPYYATEKMYFGLVLNFDFHIMLGNGELGTNFANTKDATTLYGDGPGCLAGGSCASGGYGPSTSYGFRVGFTPLEMMPFKGLTVRLSGYYEQFATAFTLGNDNPPGTPLPPGDRTLDNAARHIAQSALDQYFGGVIQVGYQY